MFLTVRNFCGKRFSIKNRNVSHRKRFKNLLNWLTKPHLYFRGAIWIFFKSQTCPWSEYGFMLFCTGEHMAPQYFIVSAILDSIASTWRAMLIMVSIMNINEPGVKDLEDRIGLPWRCFLASIKKVISAASAKYPID